MYGDPMATLEEILQAHPFFAGAPADEVRLVAGCGRNRFFRAGEYLYHEGAPADEFFLIREGKVALEIVAPGRAPIVFETLSIGDFVGASWLSPPYRWAFDARAVESTRTVGIDAACLRGKCETDPTFGYEMMKRFLLPLVKRLQATRLQLLDVYGKR
jgi:CRP/FNR family transcriptional regulator, cyclic AMP receptor protein